MKALLNIISTVIFILLLQCAHAIELPGKEAKQRISDAIGSQTDITISPYNADFLSVKIGSKTAFASIDGRYIYSGLVLDTKTKTNLIEQEDNKYRAAELAQLEDNMFMSFPATSTQQYEVNMVTDIDCTYCRRFHQSMDKINAMGITVNYIMLPRAGIGSTSYNKAVSVFCSDQPQKNMGLAMRDQFHEQNECKNTIKEQYQLANRFNVHSTPTLILPNGKLEVGMRTPDQLLELLEK